MTDLELTLRAKTLIDSLANGINPYTGEEINEVLLNDPRLIRCFFHVSKKLGEIADNGGEIGKRQEKDLPPFRITEEQKAKVPIIEKALPISLFVDSMNKAVDISVMKKCKATQITEWLTENGFLNVVEINGKRHKRTTPNSAKIGIFEEKRVNAQGFTYTAVLYGAEAQMFILDHVNEMAGEE